MDAFHALFTMGAFYAISVVTKNYLTGKTFKGGRIQEVA
jgi:hypothetical protein